MKYVRNLKNIFFQHNFRTSPKCRLKYLILFSISPYWSWKFLLLFLLYLERHWDKPSRAPLWLHKILNLRIIVEPQGKTHFTANSYVRRFRVNHGKSKQCCFDIMKTHLRCTWIIHRCRINCINNLSRGNYKLHNLTLVVVFSNDPKINLLYNSWTLDWISVGFQKYNLFIIAEDIFTNIKG